MHLTQDLKLLLVMMGLLVVVGIAAHVFSRGNGTPRSDSGASGAVSATDPSTRIFARKDSAGAGGVSPESLPRLRHLTLERTADGRISPGADDDVVLLNNQGYNYR